jgi:hypothetical protein
LKACFGFRIAIDTRPLSRIILRCPMAGNDMRLIVDV